MADQVRGLVAADIGSDHAFLPAYLLRRRIVQKLIVVEKTLGPYNNSIQALSRLPTAEVRLGDGLEPLSPGEVDCLTMTGFGGRSMLRILEAHPERCPDRIVLQPNNSAEALREWGQHSGFKVTALRVERYSVLILERQYSHRMISLLDPVSEVRQPSAT